MATIGDVAREAGVSRSTVSYALSGKRTISPETQERIRVAVENLGFTPNAGARALASQKTMVLGLLLHFNADEFAPAMMQYVMSVSSAARERGYDILMITEDDGAAALRRITESNMVDGVVLLDIHHSDPRIEVMRSARQPGALIGLPNEPSGLDVFDLDFGEAARVIVDNLYGLGHRDIMLLCPPKHVFDRGAAYTWRFRDAAQERAARYGIHLHTYYGESRQPAIQTSLEAMLGSRPDATALIVHNDATIAALPAFLSDRGMSVPSDLSVVSLYSKEFGRDFSLPYTAIETSPSELGRMAVERLVQRINNPDQAGEPLVRFVAPELVDRGTVR